jgi:hypothetical protein
LQRALTEIEERDEAAISDECNEPDARRSASTIPADENKPNRPHPAHSKADGGFRFVTGDAHILEHGLR